MVNNKWVGRVLGVCLVLMTACFAERPLLEEVQQGEWRPRESGVESLVGERDGTSLSFSLRLAGERPLLVEATLEIDPQARLVSGRWQETSGSDVRTGPVSAVAVDFFGGQGGRPSIRGQLTLSESGAPLYRVNLSTHEIGKTSGPR